MFELTSKITFLFHFSLLTSRNEFNHPPESVFGFNRLKVRLGCGSKYCTIFVFYSVESLRAKYGLFCLYKFFSSLQYFRISKVTVSVLNLSLEL